MKRFSASKIALAGVMSSVPSSGQYAPADNRSVLRVEKIMGEIHRSLDSRFRVVARETYFLGRLLARIMPDTAIILGHVCYAPRDALCRAEVLEQLLAHEGTHLAQRRDFGWFGFHGGYASTEIAAGLVAFVGGLACGILAALTGILWGMLAAAGWMLLVLMMLVNKKMFPSLERMVWELEAYSTAPNPEDWRKADYDKRRDYFSDIYNLLCSINYLWCGKSVDEYRAYQLFDDYVNRRIDSHRFKTCAWMKFLDEI